MKALIIDDEMHVRQGIKLLAQWELFHITDVYEAENGEQAKRLLRLHEPVLVFTDMKMPKMDGTALLAWIKEEKLHCKTIVITGYDDYHYMRDAIRFGSFDYILKPIDPDILNETIGRALQEWYAEKEIEHIQKPDMIKGPCNVIGKIEEYVRTHFHEEIPLQVLSERFFLSKEHISRQFKQQYGETLSDYIANLRLAKSKILLKNQDLKIYEIAALVGYQDDKYFRKVFKKMTGETPNHYRMKQKND